MDVRTALRQTALVIRSRDADGNLTGHDRWEFTHGDGNPIQVLNIALNAAIADPADRIDFAGWLVGRKIASTKDLRIAEMKAIAKFDKELPELYGAYLADFTRYKAKDTG